MSGIFFTLDPGSFLAWIRNEKIRIRDKNLGSACNTLDYKIYMSFASLKRWNRSGLIARGFTVLTFFSPSEQEEMCAATNKPNQTKPNQTKPHQTHRCHRRGRCRWRVVATQGLAVCILGTESQRRTLSLEGGLLENIDFQTKYYDAQITVRCGGCKAPVGPRLTLVRKMRSLRTQMHRYLPNELQSPKQCCGSVTFWYGSGSADPYP